ncbi:MAG TPA: hypothetical protein DEB10_08000 [Ruminococcaceae bacterium]|nr:zinc ribbon domain-containing protein [Clostridia bacterium]HBT64584.1 hypothetical protein [Oscillospiraceae bacterium]
MHEKKEKQRLPAYTASVQTEQIQKLKFCPNCDNQVDKNNKFCTKCGQQLPKKEVRPMFCMHCENSIENDLHVTK